MLSMELAVHALPPRMPNAMGVSEHGAVHSHERWRHQSEPVIADGREFGLHGFYQMAKK
jgi:hypothetical protein